MEKVGQYVGNQKKNSEGKQRPSTLRNVPNTDKYWFDIFNVFPLSSVSGPVESDPEYRLIVSANNLTVEIDNELSEFTIFNLQHLPFMLNYKIYNNFPAR